MADVRDVACQVVLVVDDDHAVHQVLAAKLSSVTLLHAYNGIQAERFTALLDELDIIILDLPLPDTTGLELLRLMAARPPLGPIVLMMSSEPPFAPAAAEAVRLGATAYFQKTAEGWDELAALVREVLLHAA